MAVSLIETVTEHVLNLKPTVRDSSAVGSIKYSELSFMELLLLSRSTNREMAMRRKKGERKGQLKPGKLEEKAEGVEKKSEEGEWGSGEGEKE